MHVHRGPEARHLMQLYCKGCLGRVSLKRARRNKGFHSAQCRRANKLSAKSQRLKRLAKR